MHHFLFIDVSCAAILQRQVILPPEGHHETVATWLLERIQKVRDTQRCFCEPKARTK